MADNSGIQRLIARALSIAIPIAIVQIVVNGGWSGAGAQSLAEIIRTSLLLANAVALVLVVVEASWPAVRETLGLHGASERLASIVTVTLGVSTSMMVLSYLQGLLEGTAAGHQAIVSGAHAGMSPLEHAVREAAAISPIALIVVALGPLVFRWMRGVRTAGVHVNPLALVHWGIVAGLLAGVTVGVTAAPTADAAPALAGCSAGTAKRAYDVAAVNAFIPYSRWINDSGVAQSGPDGFQHLGDGDPNGLLYVLQQDQEAVQNWYAPIVGDRTNGYAGDPANGRRVRPRPLVLRANAGECIQVTLTNELQPDQMGPFLPKVDPRVSMHAYGVSYDPNNGDGSSVGYNNDSTVGVGESITYFWRAPASEGLYLFRDMGMPAGADHDGGGSEHGLYGGLAVEPAGARWFDPTTGAELSSSTPDQQYASVAGQSGDLYIDSAIALADGKRFRETVQISQGVIPVVMGEGAEDAHLEEPEVEGPEIEEPAPAVAPVEGPERFGFNFGSEAVYKRVEYKDKWCADCVGEETGLSSWVYGDPSTVKLAGGSGPWLPVQPDYAGADPLAEPGGISAPNVENCGLLLTNAPDETRQVSCYTSNTTRAYQGDPVKVRFGHAGVYETHVFHLHAHTWGAEPDDNGPAGSIPPKPTQSAQPRATTIDSQTYSPWTAFTADLNYGAGARAGTVGDSIFHCHLYPHFAAGFWALLRVHDTQETGTGANPDGQLINPLLALEDTGAESVAVHASVPPAKNLPSFDMPGFPRFIPGEFGSRAPQPINGAWQREYDPTTHQPVLDENGVPVDAPAMRIVDGKALDPALLDATQDISTNATDGSFTLSFGGEQTAPIGLPASANAIKVALEALENIDGVIVTGTGTDTDPWKVRLVLWRSTPDLSITATYIPTATIAPTPAPETPSIQTVAVDPLISEFTLSVGGATSAVIAYPATALVVETALEDLATVTDATVSGTGTATDAYRVELVTVDGSDSPITATNIAPAGGGQITITSLPATPNVPVGALADPGTAASTVVVVPQDGFTPADSGVARMAFQLAQEQQTTRKFHDPAYVAGQPVDPDKAPLPGAPVVDPCPTGARTVTYRASVIQVPIVYNESEWVDLQGRIMVADEDVAAIVAGTKEPEPFFFRVNQGDCINFEITNRTPNQIGNDAYQKLVQTNMVGGHIHLVNFDVLSSDGSSNGWNYQQAAYTEAQATFNDNVLAGTQACSLEAGCTVPLPDAATYDPTDPAVQASWLSEGQTLKERWFADYELRTVFMHDHHFAAVMQNRGMFNALLVEPAKFDSRDPETGEFLQPINNAANGRVCTTTCTGNAVGSVMDMVGPAADDDFREFALAVHDFTSLIVPPNGKAAAELTLADIKNPANAIAPPAGPLHAPVGDQGGMGVNYKNAPMEIRQFPDGADKVLGNQVDPAYSFSSRVWGDPQTPILKAYRGDNVRFRLIQGSHEEQHNFTIHGTRWQKDSNDPASPYINTRAIGVSEAFNIDDLAVGCGMGKAGTCFSAPAGQPRVADFLYGGAGLEDLWNGAWGMMRVFDQAEGSGVGGADVLPELPDNDVTLPEGTTLPKGGADALEIPEGGTTSDGTLPKAQVNLNSCPTGWALKTFDVSAIDVPIEYNRYGDNDPYGLAYVLSADVAAIRAGTKPLEPLVLRANEGDCIEVKLRNEVDWEKFAEHGNLGTLDGDASLQHEPVPPGFIDPGEVEVIHDGPPWFAGNRVSMHPSLVRADVRTSDGTTVGYSYDQTAGPGETVTYLWYADEITYPDSKNPATLTDGELGGVPLTEFGDVRGHRHHGLLAALVVGPKNATFHDQITGEQVRTGASVDVHVPGTPVDYRDSVIIHHNGLNLRDASGNIIVDPILGDEPDAGERAISYKNAPLHHRLGLGAPIQHVGANPLGAPFNLPDWGKQLANAFSSSYKINGAPIGDPDTPILRAYQGDPMRVHVLQSGDRARMLETEISGHNWLEHAFDAGSVRAGVQGSMATGSAFTFYLQGAGGDGQNVGDYKYGVVHAVNGMSAGSWGILRVYPTPTPGTERNLTPLETSVNPYEGGNPIQVLNQTLLGPDTTPPTVTSVDPVDPAPGVKADAKVTVRFSESIKAATVTAQSLRLSNSSGDIASTVTMTADLRTAIVTPAAQLAPGVSYTVSVAADVTDIAGNALATPFTSTFTVAAVAPGAPTDVVAAPESDASAKVSWTAPVDVGGTPITGYRVDVFDESGTALDALDEVAGLGATSVVVDGLASGTPYRFTVTAQNAVGAGAPSAQTEPLVLQVPAGVPDAPTGVTAVPVNGSTAGQGVVKVSWTAPRDNGSPIQAYYVYGDNVSGCAVSAPALSCDISGLTGGSIAIHVIATNALGESDPSEIVDVTLLTKPTAPRQATAIPGNGEAVVSWKEPKSDGGSPITSYNVKVLDGAGVLQALDGCSVTDATTCTVTGLTNGDSYSFRIVANNDLGKGKPATTAVVIPTADSIPATVPDAPTNVTVVPAKGRPAGNGMVTVSWTAPNANGSPIVSYIVRYGADDTFGCMTTGTSCFIAGLAGGESIAVRVSAANDIGDGPASADVSATPLTKPQAPRTATAIAGRASALVSWTAPENDGGKAITSYDVRVLDDAGAPLDLPGCAVTDAKSCIVEGLTDGVAYSFAVVAHTTVGDSEPATTGVVTPTGFPTPATAPAAPTDVTVVVAEGRSAGDGQVTVSWTAANDNGSPIDSYIVTYGASNTFGCMTTGTSCSIVGLTGGESIAIRVTATNEIGDGPSSADVSATPLTKAPAPRDATATAGDANAVVSWNAPESDGGSPITAYAVRVLDDAGQPMLLDGCSVTDATSCTVTGLTNGVSYSFMIVAQTTFGEGAPATTSPVTPMSLATAPAAPTLDAPIAGDGSITVSWTPNSDGGSPITGYTATATSPDGKSTCVADASSTSCTLTGLTNGQSYLIFVTATNAAGTSAPSMGQIVTLPAPVEVPDAPTDVTVVVAEGRPAGDGQVTVSWTAANDNGSPIGSYLVTYGADNTMGCTTNATSCSIVGLTGGIPIAIRVTATNEIGEGPASADVSVTPLTKSTAPWGATATVGDANAVVSWNAPASDGGSPITGYTVTATSPAGNSTCVPEANSTSCTLTGLTNGQSYFIFVTATNAAGTSSPSTGQIVIPVAPPSAPTAVKGVAGNGQVTVTWAAPASTGGSPITGYTVTASPGAKTCLTTDTLTCTVQELTNGTSYTFTVTATNAVGTSVPSTGEIITPVAPVAPPAAPTAVKGVAGNGQVTVTWAAPTSNGGSPITGYTVTSTPGAKTCLTTGTLTCTVQGLTNGTAYTFTVTATNAAGTSAASQASAPVTPLKKTTTPAPSVAPPSAPTAVKGVAGNGQVTVTWAAPTSNGGSPITGYTVTSTPGAKTCLTTRTLTCTVQGLTNGTAYTFTVTATNAAGTSAASQASTPVTPVAAVAPSAPTAVKGVAGNGQVTVTWAAPTSNGGSPITGYTVTSTPGAKTCLTTGTLTCTVQGLTNGTAYTFTVTATNAAGTSAASQASTPVTPETRPKPR